MCDLSVILPVVVTLPAGLQKEDDSHAPGCYVMILKRQLFRLCHTVSRFSKRSSLAEIVVASTCTGAHSWWTSGAIVFEICMTMLPRNTRASSRPPRCRIRKQRAMVLASEAQLVLIGCREPGLTTVWVRADAPLYPYGVGIPGANFSGGCGTTASLPRCRLNAFTSGLI